jgi:hypothetical protein
LSTPNYSAELLELARLAKRTLQHQQRYFRERTPAILRECKDLERRLTAACDAVIERTFETPSMFGEGGTDAA